MRARCDHVRSISVPIEEHYRSCPSFLRIWMSEHWFRSDFGGTAKKSKSHKHETSSNPLRRNKRKWLEDNSLYISPVGESNLQYEEEDGCATVSWHLTCYCWISLLVPFRRRTMRLALALETLERSSIMAADHHSLAQWLILGSLYGWLRNKTTLVICDDLLWWLVLRELGLNAGCSASVWFIVIRLIFSVINALGGYPSDFRVGRISIQRRQACPKTFKI